MKETHSLVYSTESGRITPARQAVTRAKGDGIVRIQRQTAGRKSKAVCLITGLEMNDGELAQLAADLKKQCACGGSVKNGVIEIQGDQRERIKQLLERRGLVVKLAGG